MRSLHIARNTILFVAVSGVACTCRAQGVRGTVENGTTSKPAAGDTVILLGAGMREEGRSQTAQDGTFTISGQRFDQQISTMRLSVIHDGVSYEQPVPKSQSLKITVYDNSPSADRVSGYLTILQFQTRGSVLEVTELHALRNDSDPPTTQVQAHNFGVSIPEDAQIKSATVAGPTDEPLRVVASPVPGERGRYEIPFPLKPGLTRYAVTYEVPYGQKVAFHRKVQYPTRQFSVMLPSSMRLTSGAPKFLRVADQGGMQVQTLNSVQPGEDVTFELSGTGILSHSLSPVAPRELPPAAVAEHSAAPAPQLAKNTQREPAVVSPSVAARPMDAWVSLGVGTFALGAALCWAILSRRQRT
jgi:hypothetical protein